MPSAQTFSSLELETLRIEMMMDPAETLESALELSAEASYEEAFALIRQLPRMEILELFNDFSVGAYLLAQLVLYQQLDNPFEQHVDQNRNKTEWEVCVQGDFSASPLGDEALNSWISNLGGTVVSELKSEGAILLLGEGYEELPELTGQTPIALEQHLLDVHNQFVIAKTSAQECEGLLHQLRSERKADQFQALEELDRVGSYFPQLLPRITFLRIFSDDGDVKHAARNAFQRAAPWILKLHIDMLIERSWGYYKLDQPRHYAQRMVELALAIPMDVAFFENVCRENQEHEYPQIDSLYLRSVQNRVGVRGKHLYSFLSEMVHCFDGLNSLDLADNELTSVPLGITSLKTLEELELESNEINHIPPEIGDLSKLIRLTLNSNQLSSIPESIGRLSNLEVLDLRYNQLEVLPENIFELQNLKQLDLAKNPVCEQEDYISELKTALANTSVTLE